jgi:hypothetical protein
MSCVLNYLLKRNIFASLNELREFFLTWLHWLLKDGAVLGSKHDEVLATLFDTESAHTRITFPCILLSAYRIILQIKVSAAYFCSVPSVRTKMETRQSVHAADTNAIEVASVVWLYKLTDAHNLPIMH